MVPRPCLCRKRQLPSFAIASEGLPVGKKHHSKVEICRDRSGTNVMWPLLNLPRISAPTLISLAIGSFFSDENGSSRSRKTCGKASHLSIAKMPPRFHGRKRRLPSSQAGRVGLPAYKISLTYALRSSASGILRCLWKCHGIHIGGWLMIWLPLENGALLLTFLITKTYWPCHVDWRR